MVEVDPVFVVAALGAACQVAVTMVHYEPPSSPTGEDPFPVLESAIFSAVFFALFLTAGRALSLVAGVAVPYGRFATLVLTPVAGYVAYAAYAGVVPVEDPAPRYMTVVAAAVVAVLPPVVVATAYAPI